MAKLTTEEFIAAIKELSVLELNDLVKACEEEFGQSESTYSSCNQIPQTTTKRLYC